MKPIYMPSGEVAFVDEDDYELINQHNWCMDRYGYAILTSNNMLLIEKSSSRLMHRIIMNAPASIEVDHINGDPADNRKSNLRLCTRRQNMFNRRPSKLSKTGYKGVVETKSGRFRAMIYYNGKNHWLGVFSTPKEAAEAYNKVANKHFGEFAYLNTIK